MCAKFLFISYSLCVLFIIICIWILHYIHYYKIKDINKINKITSFSILRYYTYESTHNLIDYFFKSHKLQFWSFFTSHAQPPPKSNFFFLLLWRRLNESYLFKYHFHPISFNPSEKYKVLLQTLKLQLIANLTPQFSKTEKRYKKKIKTEEPLLWKLKRKNHKVGHLRILYFFKDLQVLS